MARFHLHLRALITAAFLAIPPLLGGSCTCADRHLDESPEDRSEPACLWLINPRAYRADGSSTAILDDANDRNGTVCLCLTEAEYDALGDRLDRAHFPEEGTVLEEYNELAYDECKRLAALVEDAVDDECLDYYEHGTWLKDIYFARSIYANGPPPGFTCDE